jgi:hypothetical protein
MIWVLSLGLFVIGAYLVPVANADTWHRTDKRTKGKTQQSRPVEPVEFFATKTVKA